MSDDPTNTPTRYAARPHKRLPKLNGRHVDIPGVWSGVPTEDSSWHQLSACGPDTAELFFAEQDDVESQKKAQALCAGCPVQPACLSSVLTRNDRYGWWGGTTRKDRDDIRRVLLAEQEAAAA